MKVLYKTASLLLLACLLCHLHRGYHYDADGKPHGENTGGGLLPH